MIHLTIVLSERLLLKILIMKSPTCIMTSRITNNTYSGSIRDNTESAGWPMDKTVC